MLKEYQIRLFVRVISRRMEEEGKEFDDIIKEYPALSLKDKKKIKNTLLGE